MKYFRDSRGRFASLSRRLKKIGAFIFGVAVIISSIEIAEKLYSNTVYAYTTERVVLKDTLSIKIEDLKNGVLRDLSDKCEFTDKKAESWHIDSNGKGGKQVVFGDFQFEPKTVKQYAKSLWGQDLSYDDAIKLALDEDQAFKLAKDIIFKVDGGIWNWENCAKREDLKIAKRVEAIKQLLQ